MSSLIQTVSYERSEARDLLTRLNDHLGVHRLKLVLKNGQTLEGVVSEIGKDYLNLLEGDSEVLLPISNLLYIRFLN